MTVYVFDDQKRMRGLIPEGEVIQLIHDEANCTLDAQIAMNHNVVPGEHLGFMCVDDTFRIFTVTKTENQDFDGTSIISAEDAIIRELKEMIVDGEVQSLDVKLTAALEKLLTHLGVRDEWQIDGSEPDRKEKSRAYFTSMWEMIQTFKQLYEWGITAKYVVINGEIKYRSFYLYEEKAVFRGRILRSKKDAHHVRVIKNNPPVTRLYGLGESKNSRDVQKNLTFADAIWKKDNGDPENKPKGQTWIDDGEAVFQHGLHAAVVSFPDVADKDELLQKTYDELQKRKKPTCTVEATIQDLETVPGYEADHFSIRLGDLVPIRLENASMEEARVIGLKRNYIQRHQTKITIGEKTQNIQLQVSSLITNAAHTFERLTIYKNRFLEDEALIQLNAEHIQLNAESIIQHAAWIQLKADKIELQGYVKADELEVKVLNVVDSAYIAGILDGASLGAASLSANVAALGSVSCDSLSTGTLDGKAGSWKSTTIVTGGTVEVSKRVSPAFHNVSGVVSSIEYVTDATFTPTTKTIQYYGA